MGMYTNGGATLLCGSLYSKDENDELVIKFYNMKRALRKDMIAAKQRSYLVDSAITYHVGPNGAFFIHLWTEHKDYGDEFWSILSFILKWFNTAEGFAWKIYEEDDVPNFWAISNGQLHNLTVPEGVSFRGYGLEDGETPN